MLSRFYLIPERYGQTDGQTYLLYQYRAAMLEKTSQHQAMKCDHSMGNDKSHALPSVTPQGHRETLFNF